jgi:hypothetical protein
MPWKTTVDRARKDLRAGKRPTTAAGAFVREEMEHVKRGKHGAKSRKQAIAIGLSKARRSGVPLPPRGEARSKAGARTSARSAGRKAQGKGRKRTTGRRRQGGRRSAR